jgi:uncharacterized protein
MEIPRIYEQSLVNALQANTVLLLLGTRRTGKTFLLKKLAGSYSGRVVMLNAEDAIIASSLTNRSIQNYRTMFSNVDLLIIDEAQVIPEIGKVLKLIVDEVDDIKVIASGSSSFDLLNISGEPLTGRSKTFVLHPVSQMELAKIENVIEMKQGLEERLIYGSYPMIFQLNNVHDKKEYLINLVNTYLLKDLLAIDGIRNAGKIMDLLKLIAWQVGNEVSNHELGNQLSMSKNTVEKYLDLLSKVYILFSLPGYGRNQRKEVTRNKKWYFFDNGVRNAILSSFNPLSARNDQGVLWENFLISERIKKNTYLRNFTNHCFWRTYDQQEIDLIEERDAEIFAWEIKWGDKKASEPLAWKSFYPQAHFSTINSNNYLEWVSSAF